MSSEVAQKVKDFFEPYSLRTFDKGKILIYAGDDPAGIIYLIKGEIRQYDIAPNGEELVVNVYKSGSFFPMYWAINKTPNRYFFEAANKVELKQAPADKVLEFIKDNPDVMLDLLSRLYIGIDGLLQRMIYLMGGSAFNRSVFELINASKRFGKLQDDGSILVAIPENELAKRAGLTRETFNRELGKLRSSGLIKVSRQGVFIKNLRALEREIED